MNAPQLRSNFAPTQKPPEPEQPQQVSEQTSPPVEAAEQATEWPKITKGIAIYGRRGAGKTVETTKAIDRERAAAPYPTYAIFIDNTVTLDNRNMKDYFDDTWGRTSLGNFNKVAHLCDKIIIEFEVGVDDKDELARQIHEYSRQLWEHFEGKVIIIVAVNEASFFLNKSIAPGSPWHQVGFQGRHCNMYLIYNTIKPQALHPDLRATATEIYVGVFATDEGSIDPTIINFFHEVGIDENKLRSIKQYQFIKV